jgi:hypothetical protein
MVMVATEGDLYAIQPHELQAGFALPTLGRPHLERALATDIMVRGAC